MGTSSSKVSETQRLLGGGDSDARSAAASVPPPSADYGTTSPPRSASPPATRKTSRASRRDLEPARHSELSEEEDDSDDDGTNSESLTSETVPSPSERRRTVLRFILLWSSISAVTIYLIVEAFRRGGGEFDWKGALKKAAGGGIAGAMAMVMQVLTLMPLRTIMKCVSAWRSSCVLSSSAIRSSRLLNFPLLTHSYQYRHGKTTTEASKTLYAEGGLPRFWAGLPAALVQGPVGTWILAAGVGTVSRSTIH